MIKLPFLRVKPLFLSLAFLFAISFTVQGQELRSPTGQTPNPFWDNVRYGGSIGLNFGNGFFNGIIAPSAIYDFNQYFSTGVGLSGAYSKFNNISATSFGGSVITMARPIRSIQLSAEYEQLNITRRYALEGANRSENYWVPALFLGAGFQSGPVVTGVRYDVLHSRRSFYSSAFMPFVSVYF